MNKETLITEIAPVMKRLGYNKKRSTWIKRNGEIVIVFNVQSSFYSKEDFYLNLGVFLSKLSDKPVPTISDCQIQQRIDSNISAHSIEKVINPWEEWYGSIEKLRTKALEGKLPKATYTSAVTYLTMVQG